jgi:hypothetical protein
VTAVVLDRYVAARGRQQICLHFSSIAAIIEAWWP